MMTTTQDQPPESTSDAFETAHRNASRLRRWAWKHAERAERRRVDQLVEAYLQRILERSSAGPAPTRGTDAMHTSDAEAT